MDKSQFTQLAPLYFAIAVLSLFREDVFEEPEVIRTVQVVKQFRVMFNRNFQTLVSDEEVLQTAIQVLSDLGVLEIETDPFGPPLLIPMTNYALNYRTALRTNPDLYSVFCRYEKAGAEKKSWLRAALDKMDTIARDLQLTDYFEDSQKIEWQPIAIDLEQNDTKALVQAVGQAEEKIRFDNGYAASKPEEQRYVLDGLAAFGRQLREATSTSLPYIKRYVIDPLTQATKPLGSSATGVVIEVLKAKLKEWLVTGGVNWPHGWF